jgi:hypothetical protein
VKSVLVRAVSIAVRKRKGATSVHPVQKIKDAHMRKRVAPSQWTELKARKNVLVARAKSAQRDQFK